MSLNETNKDSNIIKDAEYKKMVQAQIEANRKIRAEEEQKKAITSLISLIISGILVFFIWKWLEETHFSITFNLDDVLKFFGITYTK